MRRALWIGAAAIGLGAAGAALAPLIARGGPLAGASGVALHEVARGRFVRKVRAEGYLKAVKATPITVLIRGAPTGYRVAWVAEDGIRVRAGDPIARFDTTELENTLADSRDDRDGAGRKADRTKAQAEASRENLEAEADLARREKQHADTFRSEDETIFSRNEIIESTVDRELAAKRSDNAGKKIDAAARRSEIEVEIHRLQRGAAEIRMKQAEEGLSLLQITAPHEGLLVLDRDWRGETTRPGDTVWPGEKIGEIPDFAAMEATVFVLEADAGGLAPGRGATVRPAAPPGLTFPGQVARVDALAKPLRRGTPVQYFETVLSLTPPSGVALKPGQRVTAEIILEEIDGALTVPRQAVFDRDGRKVVYRLAGGSLNPVEVTVGRYGLGSVLIEEGLREGDRIALRDPALSPSEIFESAGKGKGEESAP